MWVFAYKKTIEKAFGWMNWSAEGKGSSGFVLEAAGMEGKGSGLEGAAEGVVIVDAPPAFLPTPPPSRHEDLFVNESSEDSKRTSTDSDSLTQTIPELEEIANQYMTYDLLTFDNFSPNSSFEQLLSAHDPDGEDRGPAPEGGGAAPAPAAGSGPAGERGFAMDEEQDYDDYYLPTERMKYEVSLPAMQGEADPPPIRWQKGCLLGYGSFGMVYLGLNIYSGDFMAIKQVSLHSENLENSSEVQSLQQEISFLQTLNHENIVQYMGSSVENSYLNIFLEYVSGGSIASIIKRFGKINEILTRKYTKQILNGLKYLHDRRIIHRDIKGENILVDNKGVIKLSDFGAAKRLENLLNRGAGKGFSSFKGTIYWMAPEVLRQGEYGRQADIWSLGCTVLEMITGIPPWSNEYKEQATALFNIASRNEGPPIPDDVSAECKDFLSLCFKSNPKERPHARKLLLHPWIEGVSSAPLTPSSQYSPPNPFLGSSPLIQSSLLGSMLSENSKMEVQPSRSAVPPRNPWDSLQRSASLPIELKPKPESYLDKLIHNINLLAYSPDVPGVNTEGDGDLTLDFLRARGMDSVVTP